MTTLTINYYLDSVGAEPQTERTNSEAVKDSPLLLGTEESSNITQVLCPKGSLDHKVTITKFFQGQDVHRWLITKIESSSNTVTDIFVTPRTPTKKEVFLTKTRKSHPNIIKKIQKGTLVEIEFGYVQEIKRLDGEIRTNKRYPDMLHQGEMHKRRLAIVVGVKGSLVRVVPISSEEKQDLRDKSIFEVSCNSVAELLNYNAPDKSSYAICNSMQTIAMSRILPPLSKQENKPFPYRDNRYPHKLIVNDLKNLEAALSASIGCGDYQTVKEERNSLKVKLAGKQARLDELESRINELTEENERLQPIDFKFEALRELMVDWKRNLCCISVDEAKAELDAELEETLGILSDV
ncbi:hypothetical protein FCV62_11515 [Vibrio kanaloae]|uniref:type II toxin-antitoxin system PemK/MazF family toxin n=1 Tax=Vibrio kanaloae TaxID=170673 RepID=UPI0010BF3870|nr:type II toxin-antitoxin system PemK/MazF family toxin [Vibrio kanaloae]TKF78637.1 hypothetical protein FCV62_11515 [Vibrio kanaloae]